MTPLPGRPFECDAPFRTRHQGLNILELGVGTGRYLDDTIRDGVLRHAAGVLEAPEDQIVDRSSFPTINCLTLSWIGALPSHKSAFHIDALRAERERRNQPAAVRSPPMR